MRIHGSGLDRKLRRCVRWKDLTHMGVGDGVVECLHPLPWLAASWFLLDRGDILFAAACSFMFFLTALRLNHESIHGNIGFTPRGHRWVMHGLSALMLFSNHSVAWNHLRHHRHAGTDQDTEGKCGRMTLWQVLVYGP